MNRAKFWRISIALLAVAVLIGCSSPMKRKKGTVEGEDIVEYEEVEPTTPEQLPEPRIGESAIVSEEGTVDFDTDRGERIADEVYVPASEQLRTVYFDFDKYRLRPDTLMTLKGNAAYLIDHPDVRVLVEVHCDVRGSQEYNLSLG